MSQMMCEREAVNMAHHHHTTMGRAACAVYKGLTLLIKGFHLGTSLSLPLYVSGNVRCQLSASLGRVPPDDYPKGHTIILIYETRAFIYHTWSVYRPVNIVIGGPQISQQML